MDGDELKISANQDYPVVHTVVQELRRLRQEDHYEYDSVSKTKKQLNTHPNNQKTTLNFLFIK